MNSVENASVMAADMQGLPTMRWGAIFGGWLVATGIASLLYVAGLALGFSAFDPNNAEATAKGVGMGTAAWMVLTWAVSLFLGGMFASWFDGRSDQTVGALHGITVWGLSVTVSGLLLALGLSQVIQGGAAIAKGGAMAGATAIGMAAPQGSNRASSGPADDALVGLQAQLTQRVAQSGTQSPASNPIAGTTSSAAMQPGSPDSRPSRGQPDRREMAAVADALMRGKTDNAKALLAANTSMSQSDIDQTLQALSGQVEKYKADVKAAADVAAHYTAMAMWTIFLTSVIALIAAGVGGWLGAGHIHRVHHLRRYETTRSRPL